MSRLQCIKVVIAQNKCVVSFIPSVTSHRVIQEWQRDIAKYKAVRHPNIVQLYGVVRCGNVHAAVFHDDLIPLEYFENLYRHSHFATVYIQAYIRIEFEQVRDYFQTVFLHHLSEYECTFLIRRSTSRLCLDIVPSRRLFPGDFIQSSMPTQHGLEPLAGEDSEAVVIDSLTLELYHTMSYRQLSVFRYRSLSPTVTVTLGGVYNWPSDTAFDDVVEIAELPNAKLSSCSRWYVSGNESSFGELTAGGWTRVKSDDIEGRTTAVLFTTWDDKFWFSQANRIFTTLQILSDFQHYVILNHVGFGLTISTSEADAKGFLFLCPWEDFQTGPSSFKWPDCPAYWSLNPSGVEWLGLEDAISLGFPSFSLSTKVFGWSWDASMYVRLRQFHQAKGFDPDSQDVARHLDHPLYQLSGPFARSKSVITRSILSSEMLRS
ncbi:hypothetical protein C8R45DRAFT_911869 [Mycena sanguinolenta]|nr:hypothetical protein C8R45DRAFT_911869 [Mycena sanguinolenta]